MLRGFSLGYKVGTNKIKMQKKKLKIISFCIIGVLITSNAYAELHTNQSADVVVGQNNFMSAAATLGGDNRFNASRGISSDGKRLFVVDGGNSRIFIYNSIPTSNNTSANVVVGQTNFTNRLANQGGTPNANTVSSPYGVFSDGKRLFIADQSNNRVLIYNSIPASNNASADIVIGQQNFTSNSANQTGSTTVAGANKLYTTKAVFSDGKRLFIVDQSNNRVLIYNSIPTSNNASADVVIGQANFISNSANQSGNPGPNTLSAPMAVYSDGTRLFIADNSNNRVLIYNSIPTSNNASANVVVGQAGFTSNSANQTGSTTVAGANTLYNPTGIFSDGKRLFVGDQANSRVLIYNIGSSSIKLGPQFEQGKAVLGKVFEDKNANGVQDKEEVGLEGVKVASDTGIYAITDSDGKFHFPYIETGQHLLKIDSITLPEGSIITSPNPQRVIVTEGVLTKVSFGVKLPEESLNTLQPTENGPLLKVSISQDPMLLKPKLSVSTTQDKDNLIFKIDCNYYFFIEKAKLTLYNQDYKLLKTIDLPAQPLPSKYILALKELPSALSYYYQLSVYDKQGKQDRTGMGSVEIK